MSADLSEAALTGRHDSEPSTSSKSMLKELRAGLNNYWIDGTGINREVLQRQICFMLGNEAISRPDSYKVGAFELV